MSEIYSIDKAYAHKIQDMLALQREHGEIETRLGSADFARSGDVAIIRINGIMLKGFGYAGLATDTIGVKNQLRAAAKNDSIKGIMMIIDSPGGSVSGMSSLVDTVNTVKKKKPVAAAVDDLGASAALWLASQADSVSVNRSGLVGSIGAFTILYDDSEAFEEAGVKAHLVSSGDLKGGGPGVPVSEDEIAEVQSEVDFFAAQFKSELAKGRNIPVDKVEKMATGAVFTPKDAKRLGLVDTIADVEKALENFKAEVSSPNRGAGVRRKLRTLQLRRKAYE